MTDQILTGFGFGPIQSGLFAAEAFRGGAFSRIVIAEVDPVVVLAIRASGGTVAVNVAGKDGITVQRISGIEIYNPTVEADLAPLRQALARSTAIVTALPSVGFFERGAPSVAALIAEALAASAAPATLVYTAENNNHAAEILDRAVAAQLGRPAGPRAQFLNTVIGKMSRVVTDPEEMRLKGLAPLTPGFARAHLVEEFNRIQVTRCRIPGFRPGIACFTEKDDLFPFEEAKLFGHNAIHALMGFLGADRGIAGMADLKHDPEIMAIARAAFIGESGAALIAKHGVLGDELFTPAGFAAYAEDLLERITNPHLDDTVERATRDPLRKLAPGDRLFGAMALCLERNIAPQNLALGAAAGVKFLRLHEGMEVEAEFDRIWNTQPAPLREKIFSWVNESGKKLSK